MAKIAFSHIIYIAIKRRNIVWSIRVDVVLERPLLYLRLVYQAIV